jgi:hypothetical protein
LAWNGTAVAFPNAAFLLHSYIADLEKTVKAPGFKHKDFWKREHWVDLQTVESRLTLLTGVQSAHPSLGKITEEEAEEALQ